ncbi:hypothetical protein V7S43_012274 [Phytophthora oleae]|uniref:RxLR effector protein n=1 Tax=Phytophthora oleae TaxID=2107226 RepID=A0ABD3F7Z7_9STRA
MKLFHRLLAGSIGVAVFVAISCPVAAQAVNVPYLRSRRAEDAVTKPELVVDDSDDSSEFFSGSTGNDDGSTELFDSIDSSDDDDSSEVSDDIV